MLNEDLVDRAIIIHQKPMRNSERKPESELRAYLAANLGGIMQIIALALSEVAKNIYAIQKSYPRLADFTHVSMAAATSCPALGFNDGEFITALTSNRFNAVERSLNDHPVSAGITAFMDKLEDDCWRGTASDLLAKLKEDTSGDITSHSSWPSKPNKLSSMIRRAAPFLRAKGLDIEFGKSGQRSITITKRPIAQLESYQTDLFDDHGLALGGEDEETEKTSVEVNDEEATKCGGYSNFSKVPSTPAIGSNNARP